MEIQMTIKKRFNTRISRIKEYKKLVSMCRDAKRSLNQLEKDITKIINADEVDDVFVCIKHYHTTLPATDISQIGDDVYPHISYCHRFGEQKCPVVNCIYHENNELYHNQQLLLQQAMIDKNLAFKI